MKIAMVSLFIALVSGCASAPQRPMIISYVDSYSESKIEKSDPHYFPTDGRSLSEKQIINSCKLAAVDSGVNVVESACKECKSVNVSGRVAGSRVESGTSLAPVPTYGGGMRFQPVNDSWNVTEREIEIHVSEADTKKQELLNSHVKSAGSMRSVAPVAYDMCRAAFAEYPTNISGKVYTTELTEGK